MTQSSELITDPTQSSLLNTHYFFRELVKDILRQRADCRLRAIGHSMSPFIKDGDVITVSPMLHSSPGLGDVVAFTQKETGRLLIHRVIGKSRGSYLTRGDNAPEGDGFVNEANILGRVKKVKREKRKVLLGLGTEKFLIALFTRKGLFLSFVHPIWRVVPPIIRKKVRRFL
jgi:signal peptidase I